MLFPSFYKEVRAKNKQHTRFPRELQLDQTHHEPVTAFASRLHLSGRHHLTVHLALDRIRANLNGAAVA